MKNSLPLFICHAREDEDISGELYHHLTVYIRKGIISISYRRILEPGTDWSKEISPQIDISKLVLLLISNAFLASNYCRGIELMQAIERAKKGETRVIPIILRTCDWTDQPFSHLQVLPKDARPITSCEDRDQVLFGVVQQIIRVAEYLQNQKQ